MKFARRITMLVTATGVALAAHGTFLARAADAECLPCVYVRSDNPYAYVEVCPPVR